MYSTGVYAEQHTILLYTVCCTVLYHFIYTVLSVYRYSTVLWKIEEASRRKKETEIKKEASVRRREETEIKKEAAVETKLGAAVLCEKKKKQRKMKRVNILHFF